MKLILVHTKAVDYTFKNISPLGSYNHQVLSIIRQNSKSHLFTNKLPKLKNINIKSKHFINRIINKTK